MASDHYLIRTTFDSKITEKDFYLGLGWLLREDKVNANEVEDGETTFELK